MGATLNLKLSELTIDFIENLKKTFGANSTVVLNVESNSVDSLEKNYNPAFLEKMRKAEEQYKIGDFSTFKSLEELEHYLESKSTNKGDEVGSINSV